MGRIERYRTAWSRYRRSLGFGVHSPFAFRFVLDVMHERKPYYAYKDIKALRNSITSQLKFFGHHPQVIPYNQAKLIFRLVNYYNAKAVLQIGSSYGVTGVCSLMVSKKLRLWLHEPAMNQNKTLQHTLAPYGDRVVKHDSLTQTIADYESATVQLGQNPLIVVSNIGSAADYNLLREYVHSLADREGVVVMRNVDRNGLTQQLCADIKQYAKYGMSFSNYRVTVFVANSNLPRQDFMLCL